MRLQISLIVFTLHLAGCTSSLSSVDSEVLELAKNGPDGTFQKEKVSDYAANQTAVYQQLVTLTAIDKPSEDDIIAAGIQYSDAKCSDYIEALYSVNKNLMADSRQLNTLGTLAAGVLGIAKAKAAEIATVAVLFGFSEETVNIEGGRLLFEMEPSSIRALVEGSQNAFKRELQTGYSSRAGAFAVIREYVSLCLPSRIEAEINNAAKNAVPQSSSGDPAKGLSPKVSVNPIQVIGSYTFAEDTYSSQLEAYAFPNGTKNDKSHAQLTTWMKNEGINVPLGIFINSAEFKKQWEKAVVFLSKHGDPKLE
ncbi:MAG: hypothetical protein ACI88A_002760 [Paraglaciecola sp.]|jgi:hypothetical protein